MDHGDPDRQLQVSATVNRRILQVEQISKAASIEMDVMADYLYSHT